MHIIRTWPELADWSGDADIVALLRLRRDQLIDCSDLTDIGTFAIVEAGDTLGSIEKALGVTIVIGGSPTWEWVMRHGAIYEAPIVVSDGFGHVLIVQDAEGVDPRLLSLCRANA
ncbi:hypothetical protein [Sphingobium sp. CAP-1]|uniref:hypothetical protein n=1 Tax=Sphingobium sp. CAP-1 TaxID=2676077 RepID=UPI0012BB2975|nr:hypothetical protein [Sphingobium sp. CAP-1]QGP77775.1 hypothetical protein GL174_01265 [Sphingobium sp. CAP-1]